MAELLTQQELIVLLSICESLTSREIADKLCISENTVKNHRKSIMRKLKINKITELIVYAIKNGVYKV